MSKIGNVRRDQRQLIHHRYGRDLAIGKRRFTPQPF
jgi:hypothetical protein